MCTTCEVKKHNEKAHLGNTYKSVVKTSSKPKVTLETAKYELQDVLHKAIAKQSGEYKHRALSCSKVPVSRFGTTDEGGHVTDTHVVLKKIEGKASFGGLMQCDNSHYCPCCMQRQLIEKAETLQQIEKAFLSKDGRAVILVTYTIQHQGSDDYRELVKVLSDSKRKMLSWSKTRSIKQSLNYFSSVSALETTISETNGLHPHFHDAWYLNRVPTVGELIQLKADLYQQWRKALNSHGFDCSEQRGVNIAFSMMNDDGELLDVNTNDDIPEHFSETKIFSKGKTGKYISKVAKELTFSFAKSTNRHKNKTFIQLLMDQATGYSEDREITIYNYVQAMNGRARLYINPKLNKMLKEYLEEQPEEPEQLEAFPEEKDEQFIYEFTHAEWKKVCFNKCRSEVKRIVESNDSLERIQQEVKRLIDSLVDAIPPEEYKVMMVRRMQETEWSWISRAA